MNPMIAEKSTLWKYASRAWNKLRESKVVRFIFLLRWFISIAGLAAVLLWQAYLLGEDISENLSSDYSMVQAAQGSLLADAQDFRDSILNPDVNSDFDRELEELRELALSTISALGGLRAPSDPIESSKLAYRDALQNLIGVSNRLSRGDVEGMALPLHNALQNVANQGAELNSEISRFQGGMWPQLRYSIF